ncbi:YitT family protein [Holzapfeliella sp. He02]|uniref:YitT family protein n=1 Tax=Holzapfeliella saturejae TaxID=3082953 RepID=A0ABU8SF23_9LACO
MLIVLGTEIIAISINMFEAPHSIGLGGVTGIAVLLEAVLSIPTFISVLVLNLLMLVLAYIFLGKKTAINIALGSFLLPVLLGVTPEIKLVNDPFVSVIAAGAIFGVGLSILYRVNSSSGGTAVPPMIIKKYFRIKEPITLLIIDVLVTVFNIFVTGFESFVIATVSLVISSAVMNYIEVGLDHKKVLYIMSAEKEDQIRRAILEYGTTTTLFDVTGGHTGYENKMVMVIIENSDYFSMLSVIEDIDPKAFVLVYNASEVHGGFSLKD